MLRIALLIAALAAGGAAGWMALSLRGESTVATVVEPATPVPVQDVLVAAADLGLGQALTKDDMRWQSWPESALNPLYIIRSARPGALETLVGSIVYSRMTSGEPIRDEKLAPLNTGLLSAILPAGKRAVAVVVSAHNFGGGLIQQNDRVDVVLTVTPTASTSTIQTATATTTRTSLEGQTVFTRTILRNVPVLAIDLTIGPTVDERSKDEKRKAKEVFLGKTATLELDPSQVEILASAEAQGTLSLALRSAADNGEVPPLPDSPPVAALPPLTRLQKFQTVKFHTIGRIGVVDITTSERSVELPEKPSGPARAPQQVLPSEPEQDQKNSSGVSLR